MGVAGAGLEACVAAEVDEPPQFWFSSARPHDISLSCSYSFNQRLGNLAAVDARVVVLTSHDK